MIAYKSYYEGNYLALCPDAEIAARVVIDAALQRGCIPVYSFTIDGIGILEFKPMSQNGFPMFSSASKFGEVVSSEQPTS